MSYAVVHFLKDDVFSEVPPCWLNDDRTQCLWPPNNPKNVTNLIKMRASPKTEWISHNVQLQGIYETLDKAIKKAGNGEYTSGDEARGRGMRKKFSQYSSSESGDSLTPPPYINLEEAEVIWELSNQEGRSTEPSVVANEDAITLVNPSSNLKPEYTNTSSQTEYEYKGKNLEEKIDILLTTVNVMTLRLEELNEKFKNIEVMNEPISKKIGYFSDNLPCDSLENIKRLNEYLEKEEHKNNFITYLQTIGGAHPKDRINRIMKAIMTNEFAMSCSWLGLRNNIKASDFLCLKIAQGFASQSFIQSADFEKIAAEWIRLSSLRYKRQK